MFPLSLSLKQTNSTDDDLVLIQFDLNDGRESFSQSVVYDTKVIRPEDPERVGYTFDGWYTNDEKWSFVGYTATEDMTFVAKWIPIKYTITYDLNDDDSAYKATNNELNPTYYTIEDEIIFERPTRENSTFVGW